uniref:Uncharacterized protein n=1 Tax=Ditylenchus dipsaci TaxID=166011 RepID=A0A915DUJ2_9BILA
MFQRLVICCLLISLCNARGNFDIVDSVPFGSYSFGPRECPPIVVGRTTYNNGQCDGLMCKYEVAVTGSYNGATYTRLQNNCYN